MPTFVALLALILLQGVLPVSVLAETQSAEPLRLPPPATLMLSPYPQRMSDRFTPRDGLPGGRVSAVKIENDTILAQTEGGPAVFEGGRWKPLPANRAADFSLPKIDQTKLPPNAKVFNVNRTADGRLWVFTDLGAFRAEGGRYVPITKPTAYLTNQQPVNVDAVLTCALTDRHGHVWFGTSAGVYATDGKNWWNPLDRTTGLPYENVTCMAFGKNAELWVGTTEGVCRYTAQGVWQYYEGPRWLPSNRVNAIAVAADGAAWVATDGGVARLYDRMMTLEQKAAHYEEITAKRHNRYGFVTESNLKTPGDVNGGVIYHASDNDGLWTSIYVAAEAFRYAVTKDPQARALAKKSMDAMLDLVKYTGVPGFPARAILRKDEKDVSGYDPNETVRVDGETEKIWFTSPVDPNVLCKGDTSSDEMDGHYFAWFVYHELVADAAEKQAIAKVVKACTDNILNNDLNLKGHTGRKTRWGVWNPKYINDDPTWWEERGLNALEILCFLKVAHHICGEKRYADVYNKLIQKHHYLLNTVFQKVAEPWYLVNHSDDEMAFMMYYALMLLERDPDTRRVLLQSMERSWNIERPEASPFFNFVYGAVTGRFCDTEASVTSLQDWPWELIDWRCRNSHRADVKFVTTQFGGRIRAQAMGKPLPFSERGVMKWNANPYELDRGSPNGAGEEDGGAWLLPYWMGRYHGFIAERK